MHRLVTATAWGRQHVDELLTVVALPLMLLISAPGGRTPTSLDLALTVLAWLPLTARNRWPVFVAAVVVVLDAIHIVVANHDVANAGTVPLATILALYTVGSRCAGRIAWKTAALAAVTHYISALITTPDEASKDLLYLNWALLGALIGSLVRERHERIGAAEARAEEAENSKTAEARRQVTQERMRIARDLHDVLAHHITVVNAQASVAQYLLKTDPTAADEALAGIADNTRAALNELRTTLGLLRSDDDDQDHRGDRVPTPGVDQLPELVDTMKVSGVDVRVRTSGPAYPLTSPVDLAIYRITQEAMTNAAKHAPGSDIAVDLCWTTDAVTLAVTNTPPAAPVKPDGGTGHGLIGMRERAQASDGLLNAGPTRNGGYRVTATFPRPVAARPGARS